MTDLFASLCLLVTKKLQSIGNGHQQSKKAMVINNLHRTLSFKLVIRQLLTSYGLKYN